MSRQPVLHAMCAVCDVCAEEGSVLSAGAAADRLYCDVRHSVTEQAASSENMMFSLGGLDDS